MGGNTSSEIYKDTADLGRIYSVFGLVIGTIVALIFIGIGIAILRSKKPRTQLIKSTVTAILPCLQNTMCSVNISYEYGGKTYTYNNFNVSNTNRLYSVGSNIDIYINPDDPSDVLNTSPESLNTLGWILIGVGILVFLGSFASWWLAKKSNIYAATEGTVGPVSLFKRIF